MPTNPHFGAAVAFAFGEGLKDPILDPATKLAGFLNHSLPRSLSYEDVIHPIPSGSISAYQRQHIYLMALVGICWRFFGVDWAALGPLVALMAAISVLSVYGILRTRARPFLATLGAAALLACPAQIALTNYVRDYAKTPFFLLVFFLFSVLLTRTLSASKVILLGIAFGLVTGIGSGIRQDIQVVWAVIPFLYLCGMPTGWRRMPFARLASLFLAFAIFQALAYPTRNNEYNYTAHSVLGGAFKFNHDSMGMGGAPYIWFNETQMTDNYTNTVIQDYNRRLVGKRVDVRYLGTEYESAGQAMIVDLVKQFPADFVTRFFAASLTTIRDAPWLILGAQPTMYDIDDSFIQSVQTAERGIRRLWNESGPWLVFIGLCVLSWHSLRLAVIATGLLIFFTGYTNLQFQPRHLWHLGVVFVCAATFLLEELIRGFVTLTRRRAIASFSIEGLRRVGAYVIIVALGVGCLCGVTRFSQALSVGKLYERYGSTTLVPSTIVSTNTTQDGARLIKVRPAAKQSESDTRFLYDVRYHALRFDSKGALPTKVEVKNENLGIIKARDLAGTEAHGPATIFFPVFGGDAELEVEVSGGDPNAVITFATVARPEDFPLSMVLVLPDDRTGLATRQSLMPQKRYGM